MYFVEIDPATPAGTEKKKFGDDRIREFKEQVITNMQVISNYPATEMPTIRTAVWTIATRPSGDELTDRISGFNTDIGFEEYYDLATGKWRHKSGIGCWTVATRPENPTEGMIGYCSDLAVIERYTDGAWHRVSGGRRGDIKMWSGSVDDIETGWVIADGTERTHPEGDIFTPPDLRGRFLLGADDTYAVGAKGGAATHTLTIDEMPSHTHNILNLPVNLTNAGGGSYDRWAGSATRTSESTGGGGAHNNMPPYYALCFLYKL